MIRAYKRIVPTRGPERMEYLRNVGIRVEQDGVEQTATHYGVDRAKIRHWLAMLAKGELRKAPRSCIPANEPEREEWMRDLYEEVKAAKAHKPVAEARGITTHQVSRWVQNAIQCYGLEPFRKVKNKPRKLIQHGPVIRSYSYPCTGCIYECGIYAVCERFDVWAETGAWTTAHERLPRLKFGKRNFPGYHKALAEGRRL